MIYLIGMIMGTSKNLFLHQLKSTEIDFGRSKNEFLKNEVAL
jgi:hypothetical protein